MVQANQYHEQSRRRGAPLPFTERRTSSSAWNSIKLADGVRERLLAQSLLSFTVRQKLPFEVGAAAWPDSADGRAGDRKDNAEPRPRQPDREAASGHEDAPTLRSIRMRLTSSALGRSQQAVAKLFEQTIPELAMDGAAIVLLDEVETLAVSRHQLSLEANPMDVHRATDAALAGMDRLTREHRNVLLIATTNFPKALDKAVLSRADHIEEIGLPNEAARREIISGHAEGHRQRLEEECVALEADADRLAKAAEASTAGASARRFSWPSASDIETAKDPNKADDERRSSPLSGRR